MVMVQVVYHVTDAAPDKRDPTWRRVVAVFVQGKDWQFRGWPFKVQATISPTTPWWPPDNKAGSRGRGGRGGGGVELLQSPS